MQFNYQNAPYAIRSDLIEANQHAWTYIGKSGNWWSANEHIEIAQEVRSAYRCQSCNERLSSLTPNHTLCHPKKGSLLSKPVVDAIHRIVTDPSRLSQSWLNQLVPASLSVGHYVELLAIVVFVINIDTFHLSLGLPLEELPCVKKEMGNQPDYYVPIGLELGAAWIPMLGLRTRTKNEKDLYSDIPKPTNVLRALSMVPDAVRCQRFMENRYYFAPEEVVQAGSCHNRSLNRDQIELVATRVSMNNRCFYCSASHSMLLQASMEIGGTDKGSSTMLSDEEIISSTENSYLLNYVDAVMKHNSIEISETRKVLARRLGSAAVVDAAALISSFQRMNRVANATGIELDPELNLLSHGIQRSLGLHAYESAANHKARNPVLAWATGKARPLIFKMIGKKVKRRA